MNITNLTQHPASPEQIAVGVINVENREGLSKLLTFVGLPTLTVVRQRAMQIAEMAKHSGAGTVMIGGAPFLMGPLCQELMERGMVPVFAFSERVSVEDESGKKTSVFKHVGFVPAT